MATAKLNPGIPAVVRVTTTVIEPEVPATITLTLSREEADVLVDISDMCGGVPDRTRRGLTDSIGRALRSQGVKGAPKKPNDFYPPDFTENRGINFKEMA